ncbi:MAG: hypothetical protein JNM00_08270 [Flavobacteriales bacterium]|nr:hypothetical protein [Flavobacteriales bacterium]
MFIRYLFIVITNLSCFAASAESLQAVLIVGRQEDGTAAAIEQMDRIAQVFEKNGVIVKRFYDKDAEWSKIVKAAPMASFLVYSGHGSTLGEGGSAGGLCINEYVTAEMIASGLRLKPNALVLFQSVCMGAGSSAGDDGDVGLLVARERVAAYAKPFLGCGASAYYANNFTNGVKEFLESFFEHKTLAECFRISAQTWTTVEPGVVYKHDRTKNLRIAYSDWNGTITRTSWVNGVKSVEEIPGHKQYDIACVGADSFSLSTLKGVSR